MTVESTAPNRGGFYKYVAETWRKHGGFRLFFYGKIELLRGDPMDMISRLVQAGIRPDCAVMTVAKYRKQADESGLKRYVEEMEAKAAKRKECPK